MCVARRYTFGANPAASACQRQQQTLTYKLHLKSTLDKTQRMAKQIDMPLLLLVLVLVLVLLPLMLLLLQILLPPFLLLLLLLQQ